MSYKKVHSKNKKAFHDYDMLDSYEAGLVLTGGEVKSIKDNRAQLKGSYVVVKNNEAFLVGCHISKSSNISGFGVFDEMQDRKLLLHKKEILKLCNAVQEKGLTLVVTELYSNDKNRVKATLCLAKGKNNYDKRHSLKEKQVERETKRMMKDY